MTTLYLHTLLNESLIAGHRCHFRFFRTMSDAADLPRLSEAQMQIDSSSERLFEFILFFSALLEGLFSPTCILTVYLSFYSDLYCLLNEHVSLFH